MSYSGAALGAVSDWSDVGWSAPYHEFWGYKWSTSEVYVFRVRAKNLPAQIESTSQIYPLVKAYVQSLALGDRNQDIRGITLMPLGVSGEYQAEIVVTDAGGVHLNANSPKLTAALMNQTLSDAGVPIRVDRPVMLSLDDGNKAAYSLWFSQAPIWSYAAFDSAGRSSIDAGFTRSYLDGRGVWLNSTAGRTQYELPPRKQPEIAPPAGSQLPSSPGGTIAASTDAGATNLKLYLGVVAAMAVAAAVISNRREGR